MKKLKKRILENQKENKDFLDEIRLNFTNQTNNILKRKAEREKQ